MITLLIVGILATSSILTTLKKQHRFKFHKYLLWIFAFMLSLVFGIGLWLSNDYGMGKWAIVFYTLVVYGLQFSVSQEILDKAVNAFLDKAGK